MHTTTVRYDSLPYRYTYIILSALTSIVKRTTIPLTRIRLPVTQKGRKNPAASYIRAPSTGPTVRPKLKAASHHA